MMEEGSIGGGEKRRKRNRRSFVKSKLNRRISFKGKFICENTLTLHYLNVVKDNSHNQLQL
jgi:hypothetical protein